MTHHTNRWDDFRETYRSDWERNNPNSSWDQTEHGYRYGWESAQDQRFHGRNYNDVESDLRTGFSSYNPSGMTSSSGTQTERNWDDFKDSVRHGWERAKQQFRDTF